MSEAGGATMRALLRDATARLADIDAGNPRLEAEYLLAQALSIGRPALLARDPVVPIGPETEARFAGLLARRLARQPLQYVLGTVPFAGLDLVIGPGALIPRGETEVLVEEVAASLRPGEPAGLAGGDGLPLDSRGADRPGDGAPLLIDVGTGSGAILLGLLSRLPGWRGIGIDTSPAALAWARRNVVRAADALARRAEVAADQFPPGVARTLPPAGLPPAMLLRGDLLSAIRTASADAVISNPPYVRSAEIPDLAPEIREHEPPEALDGGPDGLDPFRRLAPEAARVLRWGGLFAVELAPDQPGPAAELLRATGAFEAIRVFRDLAGRERGVLARPCAWSVALGPAVQVRSAPCMLSPRDGTDVAG
jgi:release factor glutamine methyltransferase